jgi:hypothetical protein
VADLSHVEPVKKIRDRLKRKFELDGKKRLAQSTLYQAHQRMVLQVPVQEREVQSQVLYVICWLLLLNVSGVRW